MNNSTPTPESLLIHLFAGNSFRLNQHFIILEDGDIWGTNPYGCDYYLGKCVLEKVANWLDRVLKNEMIGQTPFEG